MFSFGHGCTDDPLYPWISRTLRDERTPFLWKQYMGQPVWKIEYADAVLEFKSVIPDYMDSHKRKFVVRLDEKTGQLISIVSKFDGKDPDLREQPSGSDAEEQLKAEEEIYYGLRVGTWHLYHLDPAHHIPEKYRRPDFQVLWFLAERLDILSDLIHIKIVNRPIDQRFKSSWQQWPGFRPIAVLPHALFQVRQMKTRVVGGIPDKIVPVPAL